MFSIKKIFYGFTAVVLLFCLTNKSMGSDWKKEEQTPSFLPKSRGSKRELDTLLREAVSFNATVKPRPCKVSVRPAASEDDDDDDSDSSDEAEKRIIPTEPSTKNAFLRKASEAPSDDGREAGDEDGDDASVALRDASARGDVSENNTSYDESESDVDDGYYLDTPGYELIKEEVETLRRKNLSKYSSKTQRIYEVILECAIKEKAVNLGLLRKTRSITSFEVLDKKVCQLVNITRAFPEITSALHKLKAFTLLMKKTPGLKDHTKLTVLQMTETLRGKLSESESKVSLQNAINFMARQARPRQEVFLYLVTTDIPTKECATEVFYRNRTDIADQFQKETSLKSFLSKAVNSYYLHDPFLLNIFKKGYSLFHGKRSLRSEQPKRPTVPAVRPADTPVILRPIARRPAVGQTAAAAPPTVVMPVTLPSQIPQEGTTPKDEFNLSEEDLEQLKKLATEAELDFTEEWDL